MSSDTEIQMQASASPLPGLDLTEEMSTADVSFGAVATFSGAVEEAVAGKAASVDLLGLYAEAEDGLVLDDPDFLRQASAAVDHSWLDLPDTFNPSDPDPMLQQLEQAWAGRTDGVHRIEAVEPSPVLPTMREVADLSHVIRTAMRRSASGTPFLQVAREAQESLRGDFDKAVPALQAVRGEENLHGKVYIRASAFPGLERGEWTDLMRRKFAQVRYLIACGTCSHCTMGEHSKCASNLQLQKECVVEVPWSDALQHYARSLGDLIPSDATSAREALQRAFASQGDRKTEVRVAENMPTEDARVRAPKVVKPLAAPVTGEHKKREAAAAFLVKWRDKGELTDAQVSKLASLPLEDLYRSAAVLIASSKSRDYTGFANDLPKMASEAEVVEALRNYTPKAKVSVRSSDASELLKKAQQCVADGHTPEQLRQALQGFLSAAVEEVKDDLAPLFRQAQQNVREGIPTTYQPVQNPVAEYSDDLNLTASTLDGSLGSDFEDCPVEFGEGMVLD